MDLDNPYLSPVTIVPDAALPAFGEQFMTATVGDADDDNGSGVRSNWTGTQDNKG